jgi:NADPH:quinone reductase-like Zn-dependent oxidoreductase
MQAIIYTEFGGPDVLHLAEVQEPHAGAGQVRVRVVAVGINPSDYKIREGWLQAVFPTNFPAIPGGDVAGVVDEVGDGVTEVAVGDEVLGWSDTGAYAQYALATKVVRKPATLSWEAAVALPVAGEAAQRVLDLLAVTAGETVLLHGAAGAVGTIAVQLAVQRGVTVIGTASQANHDYLRSLGAIPVTYGDGLVERVRAVAPQGIDAVFDAAGKDALPASIELRGGTDRVVTIADMRDAVGLGIHFAVGTAEGQSTKALAELAQMVSDGRLRVTTSATYPLDQAVEAAKVSQAGHLRGKIALLVKRLVI